ncbi:DMT family transporter [Nitrosopumilus sp.]|uniref:DMT family transporter n=1 Tax=Nitrosopumilus sp. TaxID=2024843 RepID=UPI002430A087|nr:DMT family transporter [Nitrosopumilus sp.]
MKIKLCSKKSQYGYYFIILAAMLSSLVHVLSKPMLDMGVNTMEINPIFMTFLIYMICTAFFTPIARKTDAIRKFSQKDILFMALIGLSEVAALSTYFFGLQNSSAVNASIFSNSEIIFSLVLAMVIFKERINIKECIPFSMIIIGMMIIPIGNNIYQNGMNFEHLATGDLLIILSGLLYAADITICKYVGDKYDTRRVTQITSFFCAIIALSFLFLLEIPIDFELEYIPNIVFISIFGTGLSTLLFFAGLKLIGAVRTVLLYSTTSVFGIIFAGVFLAEQITVIDLISLGITLIGIFFLRNKLAESESADLELESNSVSNNGDEFEHKSNEHFTKNNPKTVISL